MNAAYESDDWRSVSHADVLRPLCEGVDDRVGRNMEKRDAELRYVMKGGTPLVGEVTISGAKNAALGIIAAAIMTDEDVRLENIPDVNDINVMLDAIQGIGVTVDRVDPHTVVINGSNIFKATVDSAYIDKIRAGYYLLGALLGKYRHAEVAMPGGCAIGKRPIDQHIKGFRAMNADVDLDGGRVVVDAKDLIGGHIYLDMVSVGATINIMLAAALASGVTTIENAAKEPHVVDIANMLNAMGARIMGAGTDVIRITGVERLHGCEYTVIPDQIEAGTFMFAAAVTHCDIILNSVIPKHLESISSKLREMGCEVTELDDSVRVNGKASLRSCDVKTLPYPGFPTDMQPQICVGLSLASGSSVVTESIFENRFKYVDEVLKMGANIRVEGNVAFINGVESLKGASMKAPDLRAGAALVLAGLAANGFSTVGSIEYILRGYEHLERKLQELGAVIALVDTDEAAEAFKKEHSA